MVGLLGSAIIGYFVESRTVQYLQNLTNHSPYSQSTTQILGDTLESEMIKQAGILAYGDLFFYIGVVGSCIFAVLVARYVYFKAQKSNSIRKELDILRNRAIKKAKKNAEIMEKLNNKETKSIRRIQ